MWKLTLAALAALLVAAAAPAAAGPSTQARAATVNFRMVEWDILPLTATKTGATRVTFVVRNAGKMTHEFVVMKTAKAAGNLAARGAREAPEAGAVGEIEQIRPGEVKRLTLTLRKGHYSLICNLPFHYGRGQFVDFYVRQRRLEALLAQVSSAIIPLMQRFTVKIEGVGWTDVQQLELPRLPRVGELIETKYGTCEVTHSESAAQTEPVDGTIVCSTS